MNAAWLTPGYWREDDEQRACVSGTPTGSASATVLPMTDEEMQAVVKRPLGFAPEEAS